MYNKLTGSTFLIVKYPEMLMMIVILLIVVVLLYGHKNFNHKWMTDQTLESNDIVMLKKEYYQQYPHIGLNRPMRVISKVGKSVEVTFMAAKDISKEIINTDAVKKVS